MSINQTTDVNFSIGKNTPSSLKSGYFYINSQSGATHLAIDDNTLLPLNLITKTPRDNEYGVCDTHNGNKIGRYGATAFGYLNEATNINSFVCGRQNISNGGYSFVANYLNCVRSPDGVLSPSASSCFGRYNEIGGGASFVAGTHNYCWGSYSTIFGEYSTNNRTRTHLIGRGLQSNTRINSLVIGQWNEPGPYAFSIGGGNDQGIITYEGSNSLEQFIEIWHSTTNYDDENSKKYVIYKRALYTRKTDIALTPGYNNGIGYYPPDTKNKNNEYEWEKINSLITFIDSTGKEIEVDFTNKEIYADFQCTTIKLCEPNRRTIFTVDFEGNVWSANDIIATVSNTTHSLAAKANSADVNEQFKTLRNLILSNGNENIEDIAALFPIKKSTNTEDWATDDENVPTRKAIVEYINNYINTKVLITGVSEPSNAITGTLWVDTSIT